MASAPDAPPSAGRPSCSAFPLRAPWRLCDFVFVLVCLEVLVVLLDLWLYSARAIPASDLRDLFNATSERGLGSWLAVTQATLIALTLWGMAVAYRQTGAPRSRWAGWTVLAAFFSYVAVDDAVQLHERVGAAFADSAASGVGLGAAFPSYYWQLLFGPFFLGMAVFLLVFLGKELGTTRLKLAVGGAIGLLAFAVALDFVDGLDPAHPLNVNAWLAAHGLDDMRTGQLFGMSALDTVTHFSRATEESIEMVAMTMLWAVFLRHAGSTVGEFHLQQAATPTNEAVRRVEPSYAASF